jgi:hypothetical protein
VALGPRNRQGISSVPRPKRHAVGVASARTLGVTQTSTAVTPQQIASLEGAFGFALPGAYRDALMSNDLSGDWTDHPEFMTDVATLLSENKHFKLAPNPSLERRPHEAGHLWPAAGVASSHCRLPAKGVLPRGAPQLER